MGHSFSIAKQAALPAHGDAREGEHREAGDGLAEAAGRLKDAKQQQVLNLRTGGCRRWGRRRCDSRKPGPRR